LTSTPLASSDGWRKQPDPRAELGAVSRDATVPACPGGALDFQARVAKRAEKVRARVEEHIAKKNLPADKAAAVRAKMAAAQAAINQEVAKVVADGTVTKEEAKQVREVARAQRPHKGHKKGDKNPA
jgi:hypothetical protein